VDKLFRIYSAEDDQDSIIRESLLTKRRELTTLGGGKWARKVMCPVAGCGSIQPKHYSESVTVAVIEDPIDLVYANSLAMLLHRDLYDAIAEYLPDSVPGPCESVRLSEAEIDALNPRRLPRTDARREVPPGPYPLVDAYVSLYTPTEHSPALRGGVGSEYHECPTCGRLSVQRVVGEPRLSRADVRGRKAMQLNNNGDLAVSEELLDEIPWFRLPPHEIAEIPVV